MRWFALTLLAVFALGGCSDAPTGPGPSPDVPDVSPQLAKYWGTFASSENLFFPKELRVFEGDLWVLEYGDRVSRYTLTGIRIDAWWLRAGARSGFGIDPDGNTFITSDDGAVRVYSRSGTLLRSWTIGTDVPAGGNSIPEGLALDGEGHVYIVDREQKVVRKYTVSGTPVLEWGGEGTGPGEFMAPYTVLVDRDGNVAVGDPRTGRLQFFSPDGTYLRVIQTRATQLQAVLQAPDGSFFVTDGGTRSVLHYAEDGTHLATWGKDEDGFPYFEGVTGLAVDESGNVYVGDGVASRVSRFTPPGEYLDAFQILVPPGAFRSLVGVAVDDEGTVYTLGSRVQKFAPDGTFLAQWGPPGKRAGQLSFPRDVDVDSRGNVYVGQYDRITKFDADGNVLALWEWPVQALEIVDDVVYVAQSQAVVALDAEDGHTLWTWQGGVGLTSISDIAVTSDPTGPGKTIYAVDGETERVYVISTKSGFRTFWSLAQISTGPYSSRFEVAVDGNGRILVAHVLRDVIGIYSDDGTLLGRWEGALGDDFGGIGCLTVDSRGHIWIGDSRDHQVLDFEPIPPLAGME